MDPATGPTLLGFDVYIVGSIMAGIAALAVVFAIYTALTIKDPMSKRVKALEGRREELKMGLVTAGTKKRQSLVRKTDTTDRIKDTLGSMKVLQQSQVEVVQQKLAQAGFRNKELAIVIIGLRAVLPILLGGFAFVMLYLVEVYPDWQMKRVGALALALFIGYKGPELYISNIAKKRSDAIRKGLPDALDLLVICAEAGLTVDAAPGSRALPARSEALEAKWHDCLARHAGAEAATGLLPLLRRATQPGGIADLCAALADLPQFQGKEECRIP